MKTQKSYKVVVHIEATLDVEADSIHDAKSKMELKLHTMEHSCKEKGGYVRLDCNDYDTWEVSENKS